MLPQSTVALRVTKTYCKVAYLKWSNPNFFSKFSNQPSTLTREVTQLKLL